MATGSSKPAHPSIEDEAKDIVATGRRKTQDVIETAKETNLGHKIIAGFQKGGTIMGWVGGLYAIGAMTLFGVNKYRGERANQGGEQTATVTPIAEARGGRGR